MCPKGAQSVASSGESAYRSVSVDAKLLQCGAVWIVCKKHLEQEPKLLLEHAVPKRKNGGDEATASVPYYLKT